MEVVAGIIVLNPNLRKFLVLQSQYGYDLPKGHVERGETTLQGAIRECYEETGLKPILVPNWHICVKKDSKEYHFYLGTVNSPGVRISHEHDKAYWVNASFADQLKAPLSVALKTAQIALE